MQRPKIVDINGPVVKACGMSGYKVRDMVVVGEKKLIGEIISVFEDIATIQVYEETQGLKVGEEIISTNVPLSVTLGPGIIGNIFDGIQRPLEQIYNMTGDFINEGIGLVSIDKEKLWDTEILVKQGDFLNEGEIFAKVKETSFIDHKVMVPPTISGEVIDVLPSGKYNLETKVLTLKDEDGKIHELKLYHTWPVRVQRPVKKRMQISKPLITGQRVLDVFFPLAKGGTSALPGGFGTGKTMTQHQLAKWSDADIIVYIGCGERGNEMTDVLMEFPEIVDPKTGQSLMKRTVLIANTSNMPVAAREASIYTGITIGEYFRDMGYSVALMADSTSRWAEALREMSGRLEEMPGDEGYPAYLASRVADFYERAGFVKCLGNDDRQGALTVIGAVSPPGGDISEPVSQATLRIVKVFWGLDYALSYRRHFPAINWLNSYSLYQDKMDKYMDENIDKSFSKHRISAMALLQEEANLQEVVRLVGRDSLSEVDQLKLEVSKSLREDFLQQNAFHEIDTYCSLPKQFKILKLILGFYDEAKKALNNGVYLNEILKISSRESIARSKNISENELEKFDSLFDQMKKEIENLISEGGNSNA